MPARSSRARCCSRMSGTTISIRRPTSSTCMSRGSGPRSTRASTGRCCTRSAAPDTWSVTSLAKLFRTTVFRLAVVYLAVFSALAALVIFYIGREANELLTQETVGAIEQEIDGLAEQYERNGMYRLEEVIETNASRPGSSLYLLVNFVGERLVGNLSAVPPDLPARGGWGEILYRKPDETGELRQHRALVRMVGLSNGS